MGNLPHSIAMSIAAATLFGSHACAAPPLPYPEALAAAGVSADQTCGKIGNVRIISTVGGPVKMESSWGSASRVVAQAGGEPVPVTTTNGISFFPTSAGQTYRL